MSTPERISNSPGLSAAGEFLAGSGTETERRLAALWADVLQLPEVGVEQNFFDLGGHSLLLHVVHERITTEWHATLPLMDLFRCPTVRSLAQRIDELGSPAEAADTEGTAGTPPSGQQAEHRTGRLAQRRRSQLGRRRERTRGDEHA
ncbi:phosphopantetheine-binding protein [Streptomyces sp. NPDC059454]|uniref:phosphopantetheine-binding protein n=1 Tax=Streptomyces sp. NPDC059454 TaxID=3346836 RepID=UPI0036A922D8